MDLNTLKDFFFWCMVVNTGVYLFTVFAVLGMRGVLVGMHSRLFGFDEAKTLEATHRYLGGYKLLITVFNFTPWLVLVIMG